MSLSSAINTAQSLLTATSRQTSILSKNMANVGNPDYVRRSATLVTSNPGVHIVGITRSQNQVLFDRNVDSISSATAQNTLLDGLERLKSVLGGNEYENSASVMIAKMRDSLQNFATKPGEMPLANTVLTNAMDTAKSIRNAASEVQNVRADADTKIKQEVDKLNGLLADFYTANQDVVKGTRIGADVSDALDTREKLTRQISEIVGISSIVRDDNDVALYTNNGTTLFESQPRPVTFDKISNYSASTVGNAIYIDGVAVQPGAGSSTSGRGSLAALVQLRDDVAPVFQAQLDEVARGLITIFSEKDQSVVPTLADSPGLFTWSGGTVPPSGTIEVGLAQSLSVNAALQPSLGGNPNLLRDGGINGAAFVVNTAGSSGFSTVLDSYVTGLESDIAFDSNAQIGVNESVMSFANGSVGWLEQMRSETGETAEIRDASLFRSTEALSNITGVNLDEELSLLLSLEQSYQASARLISTVDKMLEALLQVAR